ncbi:hypothetical protein ACWCRF_11545 [Streptomyces sp. NPDC002405]
MSEQIGAEQLARMSSWEIDQARRAGRLDDYLAKLNTPTSKARPYTVPTDPETGKPAVQLSGAEAAKLSRGELVEAQRRGQLTAWLAGDNNPPKPEPEPEMPAGAPQTAGGAEM